MALPLVQTGGTDDSHQVAETQRFAALAEDADDSHHRAERARMFALQP